MIMSDYFPFVARLFATFGVFMLSFQFSLGRAGATGDGTTNVQLHVGASPGGFDDFVPAAFGGWFRLKTQFQGEGKCLEGNRASSSVHAGAAFTDNCQNVNGQFWKPEQVTQ
jgi:hypothetical protein